MMELENRTEIENAKIMMENKQRFVELLKSTKREGIDGLLEFLEKSDFYRAPASTRFHGAYEGGLLEHSLKVYDILVHKVKNCVVPIDIAEESLILIALLHDICKTNFYTIEMRNKKNEEGLWVKVPYYAVEDTIPYGHGEKSVMMATEFLKLTTDEKYAIRWHMGYTEPKELYGTIRTAFKKYKVALLMHEADLEATYFFNI